MRECFKQSLCLIWLAKVLSHNSVVLVLGEKMVRASVGTVCKNATVIYAVHLNKTNYWSFWTELISQEFMNVFSIFHYSSVKLSCRQLCTHKVRNSVWIHSKTLSGSRYYQTWMDSLQKYSYFKLFPSQMIRPWFINRWGCHELNCLLCCFLNAREHV